MDIEVQQVHAVFNITEACQTYRASEKSRVALFAGLRQPLPAFTTVKENTLSTSYFPVAALMLSAVSSFCTIASSRPGGPDPLLCSHSVRLLTWGTWQ